MHSKGGLKPRHRSSPSASRVTALPAPRPHLQSSAVSPPAPPTHPPCSQSQSQAARHSPSRHSRAHVTLVEETEVGTRCSFLSKVHQQPLEIRFKSLFLREHSLYRPATPFQAEPCAPPHPPKKKKKKSFSCLSALLICSNTSSGTGCSIPPGHGHPWDRPAAHTYQTAPGTASAGESEKPSFSRRPRHLLCLRQRHQLLPIAVRQREATKLRLEVTQKVSPRHQDARAPRCHPAGPALPWPRCQCQSCHQHQTLQLFFPIHSLTSPAKPVPPVPVPPGSPLPLCSQSGTGEMGSSEPEHW